MRCFLLYIISSVLLLLHSSFFGLIRSCAAIVISLAHSFCLFSLCVLSYLVGFFDMISSVMLNNWRRYFWLSAFLWRVIIDWKRILDLLTKFSFDIHILCNALSWIELFVESANTQKSPSLTCKIQDKITKIPVYISLADQMLSAHSNVNIAQCTSLWMQKLWRQYTEFLECKFYQTKQITSGMKCNLPDMLVAIQETQKTAFAAVKIFVQNRISDGFRPMERKNKWWCFSVWFCIICIILSTQSSTNMRSKKQLSNEIVLVSVILWSELP